jgi:hypothetical protein
MRQTLEAGCAGTSSGHAAAAPPTIVMNSRRFMSFPKLGRRHLSAQGEYFNRRDIADFN